MPGASKLFVYLTNEVTQKDAYQRLNYKDIKRATSIVVHNLQVYNTTPRL